MQLVPIARVVLQLLVWLNRFALDPPIETPLIVRTAEPVLVSVKAKGALVVFAVTGPKWCEVGVSDANTWTPVPRSETVAVGVPGSFVEMDLVAVRVPTAVGVNLTLIRQLLPAPRLPPIGQLLV